jgi:elongation factor P
MYEYSFHQTENVEEAELESKSIIYIYESKGEYWFHEAGNPGKRFTLAASLIGPAITFLKVKGEYQAIIFEEEIIGVEIPVKMQLKVTEAAPAVKGNTAQGATKTVVVETGATITTPLFINEGDIIEVNTETGEYTARMEKA